MQGTKNIRIVEVGPRDGLQNETAPVPTEAKVAFVDALSGTGVDEIEVSAFVSPRWVPQLGDAEEVVVHCVTPMEIPEEEEAAAGEEEPEVIGGRKEEESEGAESA